MRLWNKSLKNRIFIANTLMVLITLVVFLAINSFIVKGFAELIEHDFKAAMTTVDNWDDMEDVIKEFSMRKNSFIVLFVIDGILCIGGLIAVSLLFTRSLVKRIEKPLDMLTDATARIRANDLTEDIAYSGELEFENVCTTFNDMQHHILSEREKNRKYEQARTDMIAGISHDLRTPLTAIRGTVKALMDGVATSPEQQRVFLETAYRRTGDMDCLLNQLFYISKLQTGNMPLTMKNVDIADFVSSYVSSKSGQLADGVILTGSTEEGCNALVDAEQLQRIFDNLLENSIKYGETTPLRVKISVSSANDKINVTFADNGAGVPDDKLELIFDEFYRVDESRSGSEGNGLGLYIVKYLVTSMGGEVHAENVNGLSICMEFPQMAAGSGRDTDDEYQGDMPSG